MESEVDASSQRLSPHRNTSEGQGHQSSIILSQRLDAIEGLLDSVLVNGTERDVRCELGEHSCDDELHKSFIFDSPLAKGAATSLAPISEDQEERGLVLDETGVTSLHRNAGWEDKEAAQVVTTNAHNDIASSGLQHVHSRSSCLVSAELLSEQPSFLT